MLQRHAHFLYHHFLICRKLSIIIFSFVEYKRTCRYGAQNEAYKMS